MYHAVEIKSELNNKKEHVWEVPTFTNIGLLDPNLKKCLALGQDLNPCLPVPKVVTRPPFCFININYNEVANTDNCLKNRKCK